MSAKTITFFSPPPPPCPLLLRRSSGGFVLNSALSGTGTTLPHSVLLTFETTMTDTCILCKQKDVECTYRLHTNQKDISRIYLFDMTLYRERFYICNNCTAQPNLAMNIINRYNKMNNSIFKKNKTTL